jgi:hypothetical protein
VIDPRHLALVHAEIDDELDAEERAELARCLLAVPEARALREDLRRVCGAVESLPQLEPPAQLAEGVFAALPRNTRRTESWWSAPGWRYAALVAGVLVAGIVMFETAGGPQPARTEVAGTVAAARQAEPVDSVRLEGAAVSGRVSLYRDAAGLSLGFELTATGPVDALIASNGHVLRVNELRSQGPPTVVPLSGFGTASQEVDVTLLKAGRQIASTTLRVSRGP